MTPGVWDTVATTLRQWGVTAVFGLPNDDLAALRALRRQSLRWVLTRDQRNAVFMAGGHSLASGGLSVCVVGKGPALSNALTGLLECNALSAPVLLIATGTAQARVGSGAFQEADQMALVRPLVKWACRVERAERLAWALQRAAFLAVNGHPGPVYLELPEDLQPEADEPLLLSSLPAPVRLRSLPAADELQRVQLRLQAAGRPLLLLGGGAQQQSDPGLYERFAETWNAAVFTTASGRGVVAESHPQFCGLAGIYTASALRTLWSQADVLLVLGSRLEETALALLPQVQSAARWVQVDAEVANFSQRVPSDKLLGDAAGTARHWLASWAAEDPAAASARLEWRDRIASLRRQAHVERDLHLARLAQREQLQVADVLVELQASAPANAVYVHENGLADMWSYFFPYFALRDGQRCVVPSEQTSLGFGAAAAVGVKLARPEAPVVALVGDGAFNMFRSDLATATDHALPVIYIVFNNHSLGWLEQQWGSQAEAASPFSFDADLASSRTDVLMLTVRTRSDLRNALQAAFGVGDDRTVVMDVHLAGVDLAPGLESFYGAAGHTSADEPVLLCAKSSPSAPSTISYTAETTMSQTRPLTNADMTNPDLLPAWALKEFEVFHGKVTQEAFPCYFGTMGVKKDEIRYGVIGHDELDRLPRVLHNFMEFARENEDVRHALIVFFEPEPQPHDFEYYQKRFWDIVNYLHAHDPLPWPAHIPQDTNDPRWEFCFSGEAIFLFTGLPAYERRNSRRFGKGIMILFQPKRVFNGIEGATPGGIRARQVIRPKLQAYDGGMAMHPDFNVIDEKLAFRWKQYCASDDNGPAVGECPFHGPSESALSTSGDDDHSATGER